MSRGETSMTIPQMVRRVRKGLSTLYRREVLRQPEYLAAKRWFADRGYETLALEYALTPDSLVVDVGGYIGDFAQSIYNRHGCAVELYEPMPKFYDICAARFAGNSKIRCHKFGLGALSGRFGLSDDGLASNLFSGGDGEQVDVLNAVEALSGLGQIALMKLNVEGSEFEILPALLDAGFADRIDAFQIQFHTVGKDYRERRSAIRATLATTHQERWCYEFFWESWQRRPAPLADAAGI